MNGLLLPLVAMFLFVVVNDRRLMGEDALNSLPGNVCMGVVVAATIVLGVSKVAQAEASALRLSAIRENTLLIASAVATLVLLTPLVPIVLKHRRRT